MCDVISQMCAVGHSTQVWWPGGTVSGRGSYRSDVCRAAVLAREGGFYTDLDVVP